MNRKNRRGRDKYTTKRKGIMFKNEGNKRRDEKGQTWIGRHTMIKKGIRERENKVSEGQ